MAQELIEGEGPRTLLLAHGAGAPMDSPYMDLLAAGLAEQRIRVVRFEFEYMRKRREDGRKRPPPRAEKLEGEFSAVIDRHAGASGPVYIGGKSMGGRIASVLASRADDRIAGCVCFGYPFHPPGKADRWRTAHFNDFTVPVLINQGTRDPFGRKDEVQAHLTGDGPVVIHWLDDGEHDFRPRKSTGTTQEDLIELAARQTAAWMDGRNGSGEV
ncbi:alpha/beta fold hydrolase [Marinobacter halodurans]|uniref:Alpha/beta fold hydrolase n=1 Tax=Marinobacter halodurans TaxID=2528979 RepID=A0ABY1ZU78_9GAMM|nr:alpha/beta family hydrolase [Marinobacter halodurans]TBW59154.1 alpha/beta fold hydrolase [Marinobacter halodurans]